MSLFPSNTNASPRDPFYARVPTNPDGPTSGIQVNSTWATTSITGAIGTTISIPGLVPSNVVQVTLQSTAPTASATQSITDCINCWCIAAVAGTDQIIVYVANGGGGTSGAPVLNQYFGLAWSIIA